MVNLISKIIFFMSKLRENVKGLSEWFRGKVIQWNENLLRHPRPVKMWTKLLIDRHLQFRRTCTRGIIGLSDPLLLSWKAFEGDPRVGCS